MVHEGLEVTLGDPVAEEAERAHAVELTRHPDHPLGTGPVGSLGPLHGMPVLVGVRVGQAPTMQTEASKTFRVKSDEVHVPSYPQGRQDLALPGRPGQVPARDCVMEHRFVHRTLGRGRRVVDRHHRVPGSTSNSGSSSTGGEGTRRSVTTPRYPWVYPTPYVKIQTFASEVVQAGDLDADDPDPADIQAEAPMGDVEQLRETVAATTDVLVKTLRTLGQNGQPEAANRLAAKAYWALRPSCPDEAERINGTMHYLARLEDRV